MRSQWLDKTMKPTVILAATIALAGFTIFAGSTAIAVPRTDAFNQLIEDKARGERYFKEVNAKLNAVTKKLSSKFQGPEAKAFAKAQARWTVWRDAEAEYVAHRYAAENASTNAFAAIQFDSIQTANKAQMTEGRVKQLEIELSRR